MEYDCFRNVLSLEKVDLSNCAKVQEMQGVAMIKKSGEGGEKKSKFIWSARYLMSPSKGLLPMVGYNHCNGSIIVIITMIVTDVVTAMTIIITMITYDE